MLVVLYAVIRENEKGVPCMECFSCDFGSYFRVWSFEASKTEKRKKPRNPKT